MREPTSGTRPPGPGTWSARNQRPLQHAQGPARFSAKFSSCPATKPCAPGIHCLWRSIRFCKSLICPERTPVKVTRDASGDSMTERKSWPRMAAPLRADRPTGLRFEVIHARVNFPLPSFPVLAEPDRRPAIVGGVTPPRFESSNQYSPAQTRRPCETLSEWKSLALHAAGWGLLAARACAHESGEAVAPLVYVTATDGGKREV